MRGRRGSSQLAIAIDGGWRVAGTIPAGCSTVVEMIKEDRVAERIAIDSYREVIAYFSSFDPASRKMLEEISATEKEHADGLADLLQNLPKDLTN
jgi:bacterioferritin (cytochrome b1)